MRRGRALLFVFLFLAACGTVNPPLTTPQPVPVLETLSPPAPLTATPSAAREAHVLRVWLPPQFDPSADTPAAALLKARLDAFVQAHPNLTLDIRIKGDDTTSLLEILALTHSAAPEALPDLIALPRADLEAAATKGIVHPLDGLTNLLADPDWYSYARQLGHVQDAVYGLPFAGDALAIAYHPSDFEEPPVTWTDLFLKQRYMAILDNDPNSLLQLSLYLSAGKPLLDAANHPSLDEATLVRVFQKLVGARLLAFQSEQAAWDAFGNGRVDLCLTWTSRFLREPPPDSALLPIPGL
jgi:ABC-type glycerol-3-phosphate transport system substrate-binding protein